MRGGSALPAVVLLLLLGIGSEGKSVGSEGKSLRILGLFPYNSRSHYAMIEPLVRGLAARGHRLHVYSHYPPEKPLPNYRHHSLAGTLPELTNNMSYDTALQFQTHKPSDVIASVGTPLCHLLKLPKFRELLRRPPRKYDLVIVETFIADCYLAWGRHLNAPMVGVMTISMIDWYNEPLGNPFNTAVTPGFASSAFAPMSFMERMRNTLTFHLVNFLFSLAISEQDSMVEEVFGPDYPGVAELRRDLDLVLLNSHMALEGARAYTPAVVPVAGMHVPEDDGSAEMPADVARWLDHSSYDCVYFSFGAMLKVESFPRPVLDAFYASFEAIAPVRVLMKVVEPNELPPGLPANVMARCWFPQMQVLRHKNVKVFVTHGGLMSAIEAIDAGVPMVGIPIFGDQHKNVEFNVRKGIARSVQLQSVNETSLTAAIKDVLHNSSYREKIRKLSRVFADRPMKPLDTAIYWVEYVGRHGKGCLRSPLVDMPWWQANLLDVYDVLLSVLVIVYFVLKLLIRKIRNLHDANKGQIVVSKEQSVASSKAKSRAKKVR